MFDTLAIARQLAAGGGARDQAGVIARAIHEGVEQGDHVTADQFKAGLTEVRAEIAALDARIAAMETRLTWRIIGSVAAVGALLRFLA